MLYQHLTPQYQQEIYARWKPLLEAGGNPIKDESIAMSTALVLENTQREFDKSMGRQPLNETAIIGMGAYPGGEGAYNSPAGRGPMGAASDFGVKDARMPSIVIPTIRRIFPELIAHNLVGVQPMAGPVGFAFALRFQYGIHGAGDVSNAVSVAQATEMGYNTIDSTFSGLSGLMETDESGNYSNAVSVPGLGRAQTTDDYWKAFAGSTSPQTADGMASRTGSAEFWSIGTDMPMSQFRLEKGVVEAKTRKLAAHWSLELGEDMANVQGLDVDAEMTNVMSYEVQAEIDRQLLGEMVKAAIIGGKVSTWSPVSADGRHQLERIGTLYTQALLKAQTIAINTRIGPANWIVASPSVVAFFERLADYKIQDTGTSVNTLQLGVAKVGSLRSGGMTLYRDTFAGGDYLLLGHKGATPYHSGLVYCPYIPMQMHRVASEFDFSPRVGIRTRYGLLSNLFGSANFYHFVKVDGLTSALAADGGRLFSY